MYGHSAQTRKQLFCRLFAASFIGAFFIVTKTSADEMIVPLSMNETSPVPAISITIGDQTEVLSDQQLSDWSSIQTKISIDTRYRSEIETDHLCPIEPSFCKFAFSEKMRASIRNRSTLSPKKESIQSYVNELNTRISKAPVDAKFSVTEDNKISVFSLSQDGSQIDTDASVSLIMDAIEKRDLENPASLSLPIIAIKPSVTSSDAENFGITDLIGEGTTNFAGSPKNRIHNFKRALEQFNGLMLAPGEEFSFVKYLGEVDGEHGYLPELVIKHNKTEPEFGGGVCQVSSTIFRAAIYSGLQITARRNHAYAVSYYKPYGMDATIYVPKPDLRFTNNTPGHILIQTSIEGSVLTVRLYGTSDGRKTEVDGPHILERGTDGSMKTIFTQKVIDAQGNTFIEDSFRSSYASPSKYPHPGQEPVFTEKPDDWSKDQWSEYKKTH